MVLRNLWGRRRIRALPYAYVESGLAEDFWIVVSAGFVELGIFDE